MKALRKYILFLVLLAIVLSCKKTSLLDKNEREWLKSNPELIVGVSPNAPPYQYVNEEGAVCGIFIDFLSIIEERLNYKFKRVYESDFSKLLSLTKNGEVHILLEVQNTDNRREYLNFTPHLVSHPHVIVVRKSTEEISNVNDLFDNKVAVVNKFAVQEYFSKNYPTIQLLPLFDDISCLRAVSTGQAEAFICQQAVATYYIESEGISNLKISGEIAYKNELAIACTKHPEILSTILTKAVNSISKKEKLEIYNKWLSYTVKPFYLEFKFWLTILVVILSMLFIAIAFNLALQKRVRQKTSELKIAKDKAEESDRLKTSFLNNMSHEIRTPLNGILGFSEFLDNSELSEDERRHFINIIHQNGIQLTSIIEAIINIATIESGQETLKESKTNINNLLKNIYEQFAFHPTRTNIHLSYKTGLSPNEALVITDQSKLIQILNHLLENAFKFTDAGSIQINCSINADKLLFSVSDTGIGIAPQYHDKIFDRFHKINPDRNREYGGNGLGLTICKAYVEILGGKIWLESEQGKGSTFYFSIPYNLMVKGTNKNVALSNSNLKAKTTKTVLIAEDEFYNFKFLEIILLREHYQVIQAVNGKKAVEACLRNPEIDLVLMDLKMPVMDGLTATKLIKSEKPSLPIVAITAYALTGDKEKAMEAGCDDYFTKPIKKKDLLALVVKFIN